MRDKKKKKEKITYIDDGRTIADMSGLPERIRWTKHGTSSSVRDIWRTYWSAVKMMIRPMLVTIGFLLAAFLIVSLLFWIMSKIKGLFQTVPFYVIITGVGGF